MRELTMALLTTGFWVLALARVTRLMTKDEITDFLRVWIYGRWGESSTAGYFATCPWCWSMWLGFGTAWVVWLAADWPWYLYPLVALSGSYLVGVSAENLESDEHVEVEIVEDES
jgi:hypothetical protein